MHQYSQYFPVRSTLDELDVAPLFHEALTQGGERIVFEFGSDTWSVDRFAKRVGALQQWLNQYQLTKGHRVAVMLDNSPDHIALIAALILSGIAWVPMNTRHKAAGLQYVIDHCKPDLAIAEAGYLPLWSDAFKASEHQCPCVLPPPSQLPESMPTVVAIDPSDMLCIIYTSGTTGAPKGVQFTHRMMRIASEAALMVAGTRPGDKLFLWEPLCHIGGAQMLIAPFLTDVSLHVVERFSASQFWDQVTQSRSTHLHYLGGVLEILMRVPQPPRDTHVLRTAWGAGLTAQSWKKIQEQFGFELRECYGMTECSSFATLNQSGTPGSIGTALPWLKVELLDDAGNAVALGQSGEIVLSSDVDGAFLPAYLDNPSATQKTVRNGRLHTGDHARADSQGNLFFVGRGTDSMRVRGENVSAWEVERVLSLHPSIQACAAVGVDGEIGEQDILLYVQTRDGHAIEWSELVQWAKTQLPSYQVPRYYRSVLAFDVTPSERIRKSLLARTTDGAWDSVPARAPA